MNPESPQFMEALPTDPEARAFPGRVRGQRLEITSADLTMYSAITGRAPTREERQRALTWSEADPMHEEIAGATGTVSRPSVGRINQSGPTTTGAVLPMHAVRPWHPASLSLRLREIWFNGITLRATRPQIGNWVRRVSLALQQGRRRVRLPGR
jgi:hypothetical protein